MKKRIFRYLKHIFVTLLFLVIAAIFFGLYHGASLSYGDDPRMMVLDHEGPYIFFKNDSTMEVNYIRGSKAEGFYVDKKEYPPAEAPIVKTHFQLDSSHFEFELNPKFEIPKTSYSDDSPVLAISDIEGGYRTFRDFLITNKVIDKELSWTFGKGHLVLVGDFVDRGWSVTQVLWLIYKLERDAERQGGFVHFIIGNHELKNFQGNYGSSAPKYMGVANILGRLQSDLYSSSSFIGRWMASKNSIELINGNLFAHGGIHPAVAQSDISLDKMNEIIRSNYYRPYFPKKEKGIEELLTSTKKGICWYRGYFKDDLTQEQVDSGLDKFNAKSIVVGHTLQSKVNRKTFVKRFQISI